MGGLPHHMKGRERARMAVRIRDGFTCQVCGDYRPIRKVVEHNKNRAPNTPAMKLHDIHHLNGACGTKSRGYDSTADLSGLITLCHKCHYNHHQFSQALSEHHIARRSILAERNQKIVAMRQANNTLDVIAAKFSITRERVRQILAREGCDYVLVRTPKEKPPRLNYSIQCRYCDNQFTTRRKSQRYCSKTCRKADAPRRTRLWYAKAKTLPFYDDLIRRRNKGEKGLSIANYKPHATK